MDAKLRFDLMRSQVTKLTTGQADQIAEAFRTNPQLYDSIFLTNGNDRLRRFMTEATGEEWSLGKRSLTRVDPPENVPF